MQITTEYHYIGNERLILIEEDSEADDQLIERGYTLADIGTERAIAKARDEARRAARLEALVG